MSDEQEFGPDLSAGLQIADLPEGSLAGGTIDGEPVVLANDRGRLCAFAGKCTHLGAPLKAGVLVDGQIRCPWHHARFSSQTGEAAAAPAFKPLEPFAVDRRGDRLFVTKSAIHADENPQATVKPPAIVPPAIVPPAIVPPAIVIVGGGAAGFACAELLSRSGFGSGVTVISDDPDPPYDRTSCSKQYLIGLSSREECFLKGSNFPSATGAALKISRRVTALHLDAKQVELDDGERISFDSLVLATGAEPKRPDLPGFDRPNVHVLRTLRDADAIMAEA
jgi:nitrite reductase/ring-hydroxylating ferredoxin subunit